MIPWLTTVQVVVAVVAGLVCVGLGVARRTPNDVSMGSTALVELLLVAQLVVAIVSPAAGNPPRGSLPEFYAYQISALIIPPATMFWALIERSRWASVVLGIADLAIAVMVYRMEVIWSVAGS